jgi:DNA-binding transcriptional LysR family regulator
MIDYRYLKAFLLTAEHSSFSKAASLLNIAQSAVSRQIKLLEEGLGEELIIRSSKKVLLTHKGKELYQIARHFDHVARELFEKEENRPLSIGILHGLLKSWFPPILTKYCKRTNRNIHLSVQDEPELLSLVEAGKLDCVFTTKNIQSDLVSSLKIFHENLVLISKQPVDRKEISDETWIVFSENDNIFKLNTPSPKRTISVESITTILSLVKSGIGVAVVPDHVLTKGHQLHILELPELDQSEIYMTTLNFKTMPSHINELVELILA